MSIERVCRLLLLACLIRSLNAQAAKPCDAAEALAHVKTLLSAKQYEEAATSLDGIRGCQDLSPLENFEIGWLYGRARQFRAALKMFERVSADVPDEATHSYAVALSRFELADYSGSLNALDKVRAKGTCDASCSNLAAVAASKLGLYKQAYATLIDQLSRNPHDLSTYLNLITVCAEGGDYAQAEQYASKAAASFPESAEVLIVRGAASSLLGQPVRAAEDFSAAARLAPERADTRFFIALMAYQQAEYPAALKDIRAAEQDGIRDSDLHYLAAETLLKLTPENTSAALAELGKALELNPNSVAAHTLRGRLLLEQGHPQEAIRDLEAAIRSDGSSRSTTYNLARAYRAVGKNDQAAALFRQLRSSNPDILKEMSERRLNESLSEKGVEK